MVFLRDARSERGQRVWMTRGKVGRAQGDVGEAVAGVQRARQVQCHCHGGGVRWYWRECRSCSAGRRRRPSAVALCAVQAGGEEPVARAGVMWACIENGWVGGCRMSGHFQGLCLSHLAGGQRDVTVARAGCVPESVCTTVPSHGREVRCHPVRVSSRVRVGSGPGAGGRGCFCHNESGLA